MIWEYLWIFFVSQLNSSFCEQISWKKGVPNTRSSTHALIRKKSKLKPVSQKYGEIETKKGNQTFKRTKLNSELIPQLNRLMDWRRITKREIGKTNGTELPFREKEISKHSILYTIIGLWLNVWSYIDIKGFEIVQFTRNIIAFVCWTVKVAKMPVRRRRQLNHHSNNTTQSECRCYVCVCFEEQDSFTCVTITIAWLHNAHRCSTRSITLQSLNTFTHWKCQSCKTVAFCE